jgi:tellurite resistance protein
MRVVEQRKDLLLPFNGFCRHPDDAGESIVQGIRQLAWEDSVWTQQPCFMVHLGVVLDPSINKEAMGYSNQQLDSLKDIADVELDTMMGALIGEGGLEQISGLLQGYVLNEQEPSTQLPDTLRKWLSLHGRLPDAVDRERLERAQHFFVDHGISIVLLRALVSEAETYGHKRLAAMLHGIERMGYSTPEERVGTNIQFLVNLMTPGSLFEGGGAIAVLMKVRMMHGATRCLLRRGGWEDGSPPINQEELLFILMAFAHTPLAHLENIGVKITPHQADDFIYFWNVVGQIWGLPKESVPANFAESTSLTDALRARHQGPSPEGQELASELVGYLGRLMPGNGFRGVVHALLRHLLDEELKTALAIPKSRWTIVVHKHHLIGKLFDQAQRVSTRFNNVVNRLGWRLLTYGTSHLIEGERIEFMIPYDMRQAWRLPPMNSSHQVAATMRPLVDALRARLQGDGQEEIAATVSGLAVLVANADGEVDDYELEVLMDLFKALGDELHSIEALRTRVHAAIKTIEKTGQAHFGETIAEQLKAQQALEEGLALGVAVAYANSGIAVEEREVIEAMARHGGVDTESLNEVIAQTCSMIERAPRREQSVADG